MRRFDKEQWEEKDRVEENDQRMHRNKEINDRDTNCDNQIPNVLMKDMRQLVLRKEDAEQHSTAGKEPPVTMEELHTRVQVLMKDATARRKSIAAPSASESIKEAPKHGEEAAKGRRMSIADFRGESCNIIISDGDKTAHVDQHAMGGNSQQKELQEEEINENVKEVEDMETEKDKTRQATDKKTMRLELLRAISTPSTEKTLITNLTFVNETQELSAINMDSTVSLSKQSSEELQLHPSSPTASTKESEFSRLRRTSKELQKEPTKVCKEKSKEKKPKVSGGLYETYEAESSQSEGESTCESDVSTVSTQSAGKRVEGKRTRHMASLSPDPEKTKSDEYTKKPKQKKHRKKT